MSRNLMFVFGYHRIKFKVERFDFANVEEYLANKKFSFVKERTNDFRRFITLKALYHDINASIVSPSYQVDQVWHTMIQFLIDCIGFCNSILPVDASIQISNHNPMGGNDCESRVKWYEKTVGAYKLFYRQDPPRAFWEAQEYVPNLVAQRAIPEPNPVFQAATQPFGSKQKASNQGAKPDDSKMVKVACSMLILIM